MLRRFAINERDTDVGLSLVARSSPADQTLRLYPNKELLPWIDSASYGFACVRRAKQTKTGVRSENLCFRWEERSLCSTVGPYSGLVSKSSQSLLRLLRNPKRSFV